MQIVKMLLAVFSISGVEVIFAHTLIRYSFMCADTFSRQYLSQVTPDDV